MTTPAFGSRRAAVAVVACALVLGSDPAVADQISDKQAQRNQVGSFIANLQGQIAVTQDKETKLNAVIAGIDGQISQTQSSIATAQTELQRITLQLAAEQQHLQAAQAKLAQDKNQLGLDIRVVFEASNDSTPLNNLLTSGDFNEFWQRLIQLRHVSDGEHDAVDEVHRQRDEVQATVNRVADDQNAQRVTVDRLNGTLAQLDQQLADRQAAQQVLVGVMAQDQAQLSQNEAAAHELDGEIAALREAQREAEEAARRRAAAEAAARLAAGRRQSAQGSLGDASDVSGGGGNGQFQWPERGPITQGFGCTTLSFEPYDPNCPTRHFHGGIDIAAPGGNPVAAADAGTAFTYSSSYGYGNHVIIVHGNGFATVYGHLARFAVGNGDVVGRGRVIGYEGSTGNSTGPHLHFEIRLNETPQNPFNYLP